MIYDKLNSENTANYSEELNLGLTALKALLPVLSKVSENETYQLNGYIKIILQDGKKNIAEIDSEVHKRNHDIFYVATGRELSIFQGNHSDFNAALEMFGQPVLERHIGPFREDKDIGFTGLQATKESTWNVLDKDHFVHFAPGDYHASQIAMDNEPVRKVVVKILDKKFWDDTMNASTLNDDIAKLQSALNGA